VARLGFGLDRLRLDYPRLTLVRCRAMAKRAWRKRGL
jgi:hypothetical protein